MNLEEGLSTHQNLRLRILNNILTPDSAYNTRINLALADEYANYVLYGKEKTENKESK